MLLRVPEPNITEIHPMFVCSERATLMTISQSDFLASVDGQNTTLFVNGTGVEYVSANCNTVLVKVLSPPSIS